MTNIYFTSDTHFGHHNIIQYTNRPWRDVQEMNEALIANWNSVVRADDHVYHLGDVCMGRLWESVKCLKRLKGKKFLIQGNHDVKAVKDPEFRKQWEWIRPYHELMHVDPETGKKQLIVMCHYAFRVWNKSHHGSWALCGHSHGSLREALPYYQGAGKLLDVGTDVHGYHPISFNHIKQIMLNKEVEKVDHHGRR